MLVITRSFDDRPGLDSFRIGPDILVTIVGIKGRQVRIGIDAPKDVIVLRSELGSADPREHHGGHR